MTNEAPRADNGTAEAFESVVPSVGTPVIQRPREFSAAIDHERLNWLARAVAVADVLPVKALEAESAGRAVRELNNLAGETLAEWIEGEVGQGIRLTRRGRRLSVALVVMREAQEKLLAQFGGHFADDLRLLDRVSVRTSARNQFAARVEGLCQGELQDEVHLRLSGLQRIRAVITRNSAETLGIKPGSEVVALIKAPSMALLTAGEAGYADYNRLPGHVTQVRRDGRLAEVLVDIGSGLSAVALGSETSIPQVAIGARVTVVFHPYAIILGIVA